MGLHAAHAMSRVQALSVSTRPRHVAWTRWDGAGSRDPERCSAGRDGMIDTPRPSRARVPEPGHSLSHDNTVLVPGGGTTFVGAHGHAFCAWPCFDSLTVRILYDEGDPAHKHARVDRRRAPALSPSPKVTCVSALSRTAPLAHTPIDAHKERECVWLQGLPASYATASTNLLYAALVREARPMQWALRSERMHVLLRIPEPQHTQAG